MKRRYSSPWFLLLNPLVLSASLSPLVNGTETTPTSSSCEMLKSSLTYKQENAPRDISGVLRVLVEKVNSALDSVVDVEIGWTGGDIHSVVGRHLVQATVTRQIDNDEVTQCFTVPFTILDTDECILPSHHPMKHRCPPPSVCVNSIGGYECVCPSSSQSLAKLGSGDYFSALPRTDEWEVSLPSTPHCPSLPSTFNCCPSDPHSLAGQSCRSQFQCPVDPCLSSSSHDCIPNAKCQKTHPTSHPRAYQCLCPADFLGNGRKCRKSDPIPSPKITHEGFPTADTQLALPEMCGCTRPMVDACAGVAACSGKNEVCVTQNGKPICVCGPGYISIPPYGCVDETPPLLQLKCDEANTHTTVLRQGDVYKECAVDIIDSNAEEYMRSLKIKYSMPLPPGCLSHVGEFYVNYTVATPWTSPPFVGVVRKVVVQDLDECSVNQGEYEVLRKNGCNNLIPKCDVNNGATCVNTVGSYKCQCPKDTEGDGFLTIHTDTDGISESELPLGYEGGTSCKDVSVPVIHLNGPNPKLFQVAKYSGLMGVLANGLEEEEDEEELDKRRTKYLQDIKHMIKTTNGAELCATTPNSRRRTPCHTATDTTYRGTVDLTQRVRLSDPTPIPPPTTDTSTNSLWWQIAYDVTDDAGNHADTQYRLIRVQELTLAELQREYTTTEPKDKGMWTEERKDPCPPCPPSQPCPEERQSPVMTCPETCRLTALASSEDRNTQHRPDTPPMSRQPQYQTSSNTKDDLFDLIHVTLASLKNVIPTIIYFTALCGVIGILLFIISKIILREKQAHDSREREEILANSITYFSPSMDRRRDAAAAAAAAGGSNGTPRNVTPGGSGSGNGGMFASPPPSTSLLTSPSLGGGNWSGSASDDIYERNMTPITPLRSDARDRSGGSGGSGQSGLQFSSRF
mmetsp:Transcript_9509/g.11751  ORF Transcript_9509/g.11751 Transcript_9509/m.11751 type:complete len:910 (+) Transcript_9509:2-2731(+)